MGIPHSNSVSTVPRNNQFLKQISPSTGNCDMLFLYYPIILAGIFQGRTIRRRLPLFGKQDIFIFKPSYKKQSMYPDFLLNVWTLSLKSTSFNENVLWWLRGNEELWKKPREKSAFISLLNPPWLPGETAVSCGPGRTGKVPSEL